MHHVTCDPSPSVRRIVDDVAPPHEFKWMSPELELKSSRSTAALPEREVVDSQENMYVALGDAVEVGENHYGFFIGGGGGQSEVEIGVAQHDPSFKWMLKKTAVGT